MKIRIHNWMISNQVNGPGRRFVLWLQGCNFHCPGCLNSDLWDQSTGLDTSIYDIENQIKDTDNLEGVTFTGGEPMLQAKGLAPLAKIIKSCGLGLVCYSGYTYRQLRDGEIAHADELLQQVDMLIDGQYVQERKAALPWRGSSNQKIHFLTDRYLDYSSYAQAEGTRRVEIKIENGNMVMTGIFKDSMWLKLQEKING